MVTAIDSKSIVARLEGSSPSPGTMKPYHLVVLGIYLIINLLLVFLYPHLWSYVVMWFIAALIYRFSQNSFRKISYAFLFAIPEEIIFRGVIVNFLQSYTTNLMIVVGLSSIFYGLAHLPNSAKSWNPKDWNWKFTMLTLFIGIPLGLLFLSTGSLLYPILLHVLLLVLFQIFI